MNEDVYSPPLAEIETADNAKGSPIKAILIATFVDIIGTVVVSILLSIAYSAFLASQGWTPDEIVKALQTPDKFSAYSLVGISLGALVTVFAGYLCAKIVNFSEYKYVSIYVGIMVLLGFVLGSGYSFIELGILSLISVSCAFAGAWLHVKSKK